MILREHILNEKLYRLFRLSCQDLLVLTEMEHNGMLFDKEGARKKARELQQDIDNVVRTLHSLVGKDCINLGSDSHVSALLFGGTIEETYKIPVGHYKTGTRKGQVKMGNHTEVHVFEQIIKPDPKTETANSKKKYEKYELGELEEEPARTYSVSEDVLRIIANKKAKEIAQLVLEYRRLEKLRGSYLDGWADLVESHHWEGNLIHGQLNPCVAVTGRLAASKPNIQTADKQTKKFLVSKHGKIIQMDVTGLEILCTAFNSQDKVLYDELRNNLNIHSDNERTLKLPDRDTAKKWVFKMLYGASQYGYARDPDFVHISKNPKYWKGVIDRYYEKYRGIQSWHNYLVAEAGRTGMLVSPSGREYNFPLERDSRGELSLPRTKVLNYLTQGFGADIMAIARVSFFRRFKEAGIEGELINTVHDSIVVDVPEAKEAAVVQLFNEVFRDLPKNISKIFDIDFDMEVRCEILSGINQYDLKRI